MDATDTVEKMDTNAPEMPDIQAIFMEIRSIEQQMEHLAARLKTQKAALVHAMVVANRLAASYTGQAVATGSGTGGAAAGGGHTASPLAGQKVPPKYRDPATGQTWTGRGKPPLWIAGKDRLQFLIEPPLADATAAAALQPAPAQDAGQLALAPQTTPHAPTPITPPLQSAPQPAPAPQTPPPPSSVPQPAAAQPLSTQPQQAASDNGSFLV